MSNRATAVLQRFPRHLGLTDPGKRAGAVATAVADPLDELGRLAGDVRRAHRPQTAPTLLDLARVGSLHDIGARSFAPLRTRVAHLRSTIADLGDPLAAPVDADAAAAVAGASGTHVHELVAADPVALVDGLARARSFDHELDALRALLLGIVVAHRVGNATARSLLLATGAYLGLRLGDVAHSEDRWWHTTTATDLLGAALPAGADDDWVALEENPFVPGGTAPVERAHGDRFRVLRGGLESVDVTVEVTGVGQRTVSPMVVDLDEGRGVVFEGVVPDGSTLAFTAGGPVELDGVTVTGSAYAFEGAVFAAGPPGDSHHPMDFLFTTADDDGDRVARFAVTEPLPDAFAGAGLPHGAARVPVLRMAVGESRWALFVRVGHHGGVGPLVPSFAAGRHDGSVFADASGGAGSDPSALVAFSWEEREPFAVRVLLPQRLAAADDDDGTALRQPLRALLERHVAAGIHVYVDYADDRWIVGSGVLRDPETTEPIGTVVHGTSLWAADTPTEPPA